MRRHRDSVDAAMQQLQELLSGASLRAVAGFKHLGEVVNAVIGAGDDAGIQVDGKKRDAWVAFMDSLSGLADLGRLFVPAGILWRAPAAGDGAHVVRGRKMRGPGASLVMADGGNGKDAAVPDWFPDDAGLFDTSKPLHVDAAKGPVTIVAYSGDGSKTATITIDQQKVTVDGNGATVTVDGGSQKVTVDAQTIELTANALHPLPLFDTFQSDFATAWNLLLGVLQAGTEGTPAAQQLTALAAALANLQAFATNMTSGTYNSQAVKNG